MGTEGAVTRSVRDHLLRVAGAHRTQALNAQLAGLLALVAGILNSVGFVAVSVYTSHMTGITASLADHVVLGGAGVVGTAGCALASFVLGSMACAWVFNWGRRRELRGRYALVLVVEAVLILCFGLLADVSRWSHDELLFVGVLCFTMGLQNAVITKISGAQIRTTHVTGMITDIGIELGKLTYVPRTPGLAPVQADLARLGLLVTLVSLFFVGGVVGAAGYLRFGFVTLVPAALVLLVASAAPVLADLRHARRR